MFKQLVLLLGLVFVMSACNDGGTAVSTPTLLPTPEPDGLTEVTAVVSPSSVPPTAVPVRETAVATETTTDEPEATNTATVTPLPEVTATMTPLPSPTVSPTTPAAPVSEPVAVALADGERAIFTFDGVRFEPWLFFVEASGELDTAVAVYAAPVNDGTDLTALTSEAAADNAGAGIPELIVFTPDSDGEFSLVVTGVGEGTAVVHTVDSRTATSTSSLAAGEINKSASFSGDVPATYIFVSPLGQEDLALRAVAADGQQIAEANFGGPGSAEALFVLPPQTAGFHFEVSETNGAAAEYYLFMGSGLSPESEE